MLIFCLILTHGFLLTPNEFSQGKLNSFLFMSPLNLGCNFPCSGGLLLLKQQRPNCNTLYFVSVCKGEYLPPASFRFVVAHYTLAIG